jgi:transcription elongation factor Elf1
MVSQHDHDDALDTEYTREPICPHCGYQMRDAWEDVDGQDEWQTVECGRCEKDYRVIRHVAVSFSTEIPDPAPGGTENG